MDSDEEEDIKPVVAQRKGAIAGKSSKARGGSSRGKSARGAKVAARKNSSSSTSKHGEKDATTRFAPSKEGGEDADALIDDLDKEGSGWNEPDLKAPRCELILLMSLM